MPKNWLMLSSGRSRNQLRFFMRKGR